jgi:hypothetical protein
MTTPLVELYSLMLVLAAAARAAVAIFAPMRDRVR